MISGISITIPEAVFRSFPPAVQNQILDRLRNGEAKEPTVNPASSDESDYDFGVLPTELSPAQFFKMLDGCAEKTKAALRAMVGGPEPHFQVADVAKALDCGPNELSGVWSGITKRIRNVTSDPEAVFCVWGKPVLANGQYADQLGTISEATYRSARRVFGL